VRRVIHNFWKVIVTHTWPESSEGRYFKIKFIMIVFDTFLESIDTVRYDTNLF